MPWVPASAGMTMHNTAELPMHWVPACAVMTMYNFGLTCGK